MAGRWSSERSHPTLFGLSLSTIKDDGVADVLRGDQGQDWFWVHLLDDSDRKGNEGVN